MNGACCVEGNACSGKTCGTVVNNCGRTVTCAPNSCGSYTSCQNNNCACQTGIRPLACSNAADPACGFWGFETGTTEGWFVEQFSNASTGAASVSTNFHTGAGTRSLAAGFNGVDGRFLSLKVSFCATQIAGATVRAHLHFDITTPTDPISVYARLYAGDNSVEFFAGVPSNDVLLEGVVPINSPPVSYISVSIDTSDTPQWTGSVFIDSIQIIQ